MNDEQKIKEAHQHLRRLMYDDYTQRLFRMASLASNRRTKYFTDGEVKYIIDGLNHKGRFRQEWEGRAEFFWRFMDTIVDGNYARLLLSAAFAASQRGVDWNDKPELQAEKSYEQWLEEERERGLEEWRQKHEQRRHG